MDKGTIIRTVVLAYALVNQVLVMQGVNSMPFAEGEVETFVSGALTVVASTVAWYKNNYVGKKGKAQSNELKKKGLK